MSQTELPLPEFEDRAPPDRFCDLILTGGVTSAIAYPGAIFALASFYRFNSIGGSSSGGGAAALAAAAEYRRRRGSSDGFRVLADRTSALAKVEKGKTGLEWLFQPAKQHRRLFSALVPGVAKPEGKKKKLFFGVLRAYKAFILAAIALAVGIVWLVSRYSSAQGWIAYVGLSFIGAVVALILTFAHDLRKVARSDYGMCSGMDALPGAPRKPLTVWLHDLIQDIAGRTEGDAPLTFDDLASAPGSPRETLGDFTKNGSVSIQLQMFTANVTHGRPYLLPQQEDDPQAAPPLYFRPREMDKLFPPEVVAHMMKDNKPYLGSERVEGPPGATRARRKARLPRASELPPEDALWPLPRADLPIVVAARMSISFPLLFTAVPLWTLDSRHGKGKPRFRRCLFVDGGLCANFPIHLFDSPIPAWPTFGIALHERPALRPMNRMTGEAKNRFVFKQDEEPCCEKVMAGAVQLPQDHLAGTEDRWNLFEQNPGSLHRLFGFAGALVSTMKDWNDATLSRLPGVRDRVVQVGLRPGIGGLNILMSESMIRCLGQTGQEAAKELLSRFSKGSAPGGMAQGWNEHRWVRFNVLSKCLAECLDGLGRSAEHTPYARPLREQIRDAIDEGPLRVPAQGESAAAPSAPPVREFIRANQLLPAQAAALEGVLDSLLEAERALNGPHIEQPYKPSPRPNFRIRPPM